MVPKVSKLNFFINITFENNPNVRIGGVMTLDDLSPGLKISPRPQGSISVSPRPVQVQEQVAKKSPVYLIKCPKTVILGLGIDEMPEFSYSGPVYG